MPAQTRNVQKVGTKFVKILAYLEQPKTKTPCQVTTTTNEKQTLIPSSSAGCMEQKTTEAKRKSKQKGIINDRSQKQKHIMSSHYNYQWKANPAPQLQRWSYGAGKSSSKKKSWIFLNRGNCRAALAFFQIKEIKFDLLKNSTLPIFWRPLARGG